MNEVFALGRSLPISTKFSIEVAKYLKGRTTKRAKTILENVITKEIPIPYTRFNSNRGHKKGMGPGGYPVNVAKCMLMLIKSAEANAVDKGLSKDNLIITQIIPNQASRAVRGGRKGGVEAKSTHLKVVIGVKKWLNENS